MKKFPYTGYCGSRGSALCTSLSTLRVNAIQWLVLVTLAFAPQAQAQSNAPSEIEKAQADLLNSLMMGGDLPAAGPSASGARESIPGLQERRRALIAAHGAQSPQVADASRNLANTQKRYADELFKEGKFREALPLYQEVVKDRESRTGPDSPATAASRNDVAKTLEQIKLSGNPAK